MDGQVLAIFLTLVFITVFLLSQVLILPTLGTNRAERKKLKKRYEDVLSSHGMAQHSIIKAKRIDKLSPFWKRIESLPAMQNLQVLLEQAGKDIFAYQFMLWVIIFSIISGIGGWLYFQNYWAAIGGFICILILPFIWLIKKRTKYMALFEEQLPEALDMMARALRTGYPFVESMKVVSTEMEEPISKEFGMTFDEINYGRDVELAYALMIERVPSVSLIAMITAIMIQRESGGNLAEVLLKISSVLRGRFKLQRQIKTLSSEGIFAAWGLCLMPFVMFFALSFINPAHFDALLENPKGYYVFIAIGVLEVLAIFWIKKIVTIDA